jgi:hypothetical protein
MKGGVNHLDSLRAILKLSCFVVPIGMINMKLFLFQEEALIWIINKNIVEHKIADFNSAEQKCWLDFETTDGYKACVRSEQSKIEAREYATPFALSDRVNGSVPPVSSVLLVLLLSLPFCADAMLGAFFSKRQIEKLIEMSNNTPCYHSPEHDDRGPQRV